MTDAELLLTVQSRKKSGWLISVKSVFAALAIIAVTGCAKEPPKCTDPQTLELVKSIIAGMVSEKEFPEANKQDVVNMLSIDLAAPTDYNEKISKFSCDANLKVTPIAIDSDELRYTSEVTGINIIRDIVNLRLDLSELVNSPCEKGMCKTTIQFTSQSVEGQHQVSVSGIPTALVQTVGINASLKNLERIGTKNRIANAANPPPKATAAASGADESPTIKVDPSSKANPPAKCVQIELEKWQTARDKAISAWCKDLEKSGEECRISVGQEDAVKTAATEEISAQCK